MSNIDFYYSGFVSGYTMLRKILLYLCGVKGWSGKTPCASGEMEAEPFRHIIIETYLSL